MLSNLKLFHFIFLVQYRKYVTTAALELLHMEEK